MASRKVTSGHLAAQGFFSAVLAFGIVTADPVCAGEREGVSRWRAEIAEASARFGVPVLWIEQVMRAESRGRTVQNGRPITSSAGAMGLMQVMPATWAELRARLGLGSDPNAPRDNILAGTAYLREMSDRTRYSASLATGRPRPAETRAYLAEVAGGVDVAATAARLETGTRRGAQDRPGFSRQTIFVVLGQTAAKGELSQRRQRFEPSPLARTQIGSSAANSEGEMLRPGARTDPLFAVRAVP